MHRSIKDRAKSFIKRLYAIATMTALLGWLPAGLCLILIDVAVANGAREWAELTFDAVFIGLYLAFLGAGAWIYSTLDLS